MREELPLFTVAEAQREKLQPDGCVEIVPTELYYPGGKPTAETVRQMRRDHTRLAVVKIPFVEEEIMPLAPPWNGGGRFSGQRKTVRGQPETLGLLMEDGCVLNPQESCVLRRWEKEIELIHHRCDLILGRLDRLPRPAPMMVRGHEVHMLQSIDYHDIANLEIDLQRRFGLVRSMIFGVIVSGQTETRQAMDAGVLLDRAEHIVRQFHVRIDSFRQKLPA